MTVLGPLRCLTYSEFVDAARSSRATVRFDLGIKERDKRRSPSAVQSATQSGQQSNFLLGHTRIGEAIQ